MQWLTNLPLGDKPVLQIAVFAGIALVAIIALIVAYRAFFGHRLRFSGGGKARQPRLGLVDAFSLDGQRQLVIVRRDNVEHLLMIGGPNDIVVESQIVRVQLQALQRDKDVAPPPAGPAAPKPMAPVPEQAPMKASPAPSVLPVRPATTPGPVAVPGLARTPIRSEPIPPPPRPSQATPLQNPPPPAAASAAPIFPPKTQPAIPQPAIPQPTIEPAESRAPAKPLVLPLRPGNPPPKPSPLPPPIVVSAGPSAPPAPPAKSLVIPMPPPAPIQKAPNPPAPPPASGAKSDPFAGVDSLEAEMARLLGRDS
jgi:flagellar protein FliO/FliZ